MISTLLTNPPVSGLRGSAPAVESRTQADEQVLGRGETRARESAVASPAVARRSGGTVPLSAEAIVALQNGSETQPSSQKRPEAAGARSPADDASGDDSTGQPRGEGSPAQNDAAGADDQGAAPTDQQATQQAGQKKEDPDGDGLSEAEEKQVEKLRQRDQEVRAHEQAHARVGGPYASAPSYTFQQGPDGKRYAVGGEVQIDTSTERTPEATIRKMQIVIRAALAPAEPSSQDLRVAQQARAQLSAAQAEARQKKADELQGDGEEGAAAQPAEGPGAAAGADTGSDTPTAENDGAQPQRSTSKSVKEAAEVYARVFEQAQQAFTAGANSNFQIF